MGDYYRAIFTLNKPGASSAQAQADAWQCVQDWAAAEYGTTDRRYARSSTNGDLNLCNLVHWYTDALDCIWRMSVRLATDGNAVEADIELRATDTDPNMLSIELIAQPPSVVRTLFERFECNVGADSLATNATRIGPEDADSFVQNELFNQDRLLPLLVITDPRDGSPVLDADKAQQELAGIAKVFAYSHNTAWNVARELPQSLWCYDGAARLFAPGCSEDDLPQQHPYWLSWHLYRMMQHNRLWQMLRDESLLRMSNQRQGRLFSRVENAINEEETKTLQDRMTKLEEANPTAKDFHELLELLEAFYDSADVENYKTSEMRDLVIGAVKRVNYRANRLELDNNHLRAENSELRAQVFPSAAKSAPPREEDTSTKPRFFTIQACAEHAAQNLPHLRFLPNAHKTAGSGYTRQHDDNANRIYTTFGVLNECGRQRTQPGGLGKNVELWLKENREEYSDESEPTKRAYRNERTFFDPDKDDYIFMPHHIKLIGNKIRIHLTWDIDENKWLIGYIGRHLRTSESPN